MSMFVPGCRVVQVFEQQSCILASAATASVGINNTGIIESNVCNNQGTCIYPNCANVQAAHKFILQHKLPHHIRKYGVILRKRNCCVKMRCAWQKELSLKQLMQRYTNAADVWVCEMPHISRD